MTLIQLKLLSALLVLMTAIIAGIIPFKKRIKSQMQHDFPIGEALACGVFLGAGLIHMLGNASQAFHLLGYQYPLAFFIAGVTFLLMLWLEHLGRELHQHQGATSSLLSLLAIILLSFHSLFAGAALGLSQNISVVIIILIAILAHKWAAGFALAVQLSNSHLKLRAAIIGFSIFALMTPLGIIAGDLVTGPLHNYQLIEPIISSIAAGTFIYLGTLHGLKRAVMVERCCNLKHFSFVLLGFALMAAVAVWV